MAERLREIEGENLHPPRAIYDALERFTRQFFSLRNLAEASARYIFTISVARSDVLREEERNEKFSLVTKFFNCAKIKAHLR